MSSAQFYLPVQSDGLIRLDDIVQAIKPETILVSVMMANNETGVIQPIKEKKADEPLLSSTTVMFMPLSV